MEFYQKLLSKNGISTMELAKEFLSCKVGERIPTVTELNEKISLARGTIQNSIKFLQDNGAIELVARGHLGTFLVKKNTRILLSCAGITSIVGVMPLPYSKRYEGFASGLIAAMENQYNIPASMAYMRGAANRASMLIANRYDFAVVSLYAAQHMLEKNMEVQIIKRFGLHSYLSKHIIVFHSSKDHEIKDHMKIGLDSASIDHKFLTEKACAGKQVEFVHVEYHQILKKVIAGDIDAAIWNEDEITDKMMDVNYSVLETDNPSDTEAVIVVNAQRKELISLLSEIIDVPTVLSIQSLVLEDKITPSY